MHKRTTFCEEPRRLQYDLHGRTLVTPDNEGELRYVYENGSFDECSRVDPRTQHVTVDETVLRFLADKVCCAARPIDLQLTIEQGSLAQPA